MRAPELQARAGATPTSWPKRPTVSPLPMRSPFAATPYRPIWESLAVPCTVFQEAALVGLLGTFSAALGLVRSTTVEYRPAAIGAVLPCALSRVTVATYWPAP